MPVHEPIFLDNHSLMLEYDQLLTKQDLDRMKITAKTKSFIWMGDRNCNTYFPDFCCKLFQDN